MSNSKLFLCTLISPNKNSPRNHKIDTITIHCVIRATCREDRRNLQSRLRDRRSNYGIGYDGRIRALRR